MKSFFKLSAIGISILALNGTGFANARTYDSNAWSSQFRGAFIGVEGLDLRPMNGDLDYVTIASEFAQSTRI